MPQPYISGSITINASIAKVWRSLTDPAWTKKYMFDCEPITDWKPGSPVNWKGATDGKIYVKGHVVTIRPERYLEYTVFDPNGTYTDVPSNYLSVIYELTEKNGQTVLSMKSGDYTKVEDGEKRYQHSVGGWETILGQIKTLVEADSAK